MLATRKGTHMANVESSNNLLGNVCDFALEE